MPLNKIENIGYIMMHGKFIPNIHNHSKKKVFAKFKGTNSKEITSGVKNEWKFFFL